MNMWLHEAEISKPSFFAFSVAISSMFPMLHAESVEHSGQVIEINKVIPSVERECTNAIEHIEQLLNDYLFNDEEIFGIRLALMEAIMNAIKHGNQRDASKTVGIRCVINGERFDCCISDEGDGFDLDDVPDPTDAENLDRLSGRGMYLIKHYMTYVEYTKPGNSVMLTRLRGEAHKNNVANRDAGTDCLLNSLARKTHFEICKGCAKCL